MRDRSSSRISRSSSFATPRRKAESADVTRVEGGSTASELTISTSDTPSTTRPTVCSEHTVGLVVDGVSEVLMVSSEAVEPPSTLVTSADSAFLRGVAKLDERLILLLDLSRILTRTEQEDLAA